MTTAVGAEHELPPGLNASTMCEAFQRTAGEFADNVALRTIGDEVTITFREYAERVRVYAAALHALGVRRGDTVGVMLINRPEFHLLDAAAMHLGATPFSIYNTSSAEQIAYLLEDAANRVLITQASLLEQVRQGMSDASAVEHVIVLDETPADGLSLARLEELAVDSDLDFEAAWRAVEPDDVLTLIYTSGTTGPPKGVQLTHANELAQCRSLNEVAPWHAAGSVVSFLPMAHIADRGLSHYAQMICGYTVTSCPEPTQVFEHVLDARPTVFGSVPRIWEKLKAALEAGIEAEPDAALRESTREAIELGLKKVRMEQAGETVPDDLHSAYEEAERGVFAPLRAQLGFDRCERYVIGAAPTPLEVLEFFAAIGIPICEVWGMSELSSIATYVPPGKLRLGTVGPPIPGVDVRLADDGEVLVRGATVMAGYRNQPQKTSETIDADGWLHSGDIGEWDEAGYLKIIDRKKELIINAAGKNMSPANIEAQLKSGSPLIGQAVAIGDGRPYNVALIVLDPDAAAGFAAARGLDDALESLARDPAVLAEVRAGVERANGGLSRVEQIKRFQVLPVDWPPAGDELTPTMKLKRKPIAQKYAQEIEALYTR